MWVELNGNWEIFCPQKHSPGLYHTVEARHRTYVMSYSSCYARKQARVRLSPNRGEGNIIHTPSAYRNPSVVCRFFLFLHLILDAYNTYYTLLIK